jgi:hypothetical protein
MLLRELFEQDGKTAVIAFGRLNPPTIGHAKLVDTIKSIDGDHYLFLSHTQKPKTDPLDFNTKAQLAKQFFPGVKVGHPAVKTPVLALEYLQGQGYTDVIFVAGSDRVEGFQKLFDTYNGQPDKTGKVPFKFNSIKVVSAGERDPDADDVSGMSASKMRAMAAAGELEAFAQGVPDKRLAKTMYDAVRKGMGINEEASSKPVDMMKTLQKIAGFHHVEHAVDEFNRGLSYEQKVNGLNPNATETRKKVFNNIAKKWNFYTRLLDENFADGVNEGPKDFADMQLDNDKIQQELDYFYTGHAPVNIGGRKDAGSFKGLNIVTFTKGKNTLMFLVNKDDQAVFYVAYRPAGDGVAIGNVRSNGAVRATEVYAYLVDKFGTLYSDSKQTTQGRKIWADLAKFYPNLKITDVGNRLKATNKVEENFADGKKPGRKGLAKRSGVNTKASVSSLRKTAKSSSGEKQRMAHWLANMKAGRAKKKANEAIAPHGSPEDEFEMMKAGTKPAALVLPHTFLELYKPTADKLGWPYHQVEIVGREYDSYVVGQPGEEKRVQRLVKLLQDLNANVIKPDKEYHIEVGRLLGYSNQDIQDFLKKVDLAEGDKKK